MKNFIVYYDLADINYSSFFIRGFQDICSLYNYKFIVSKTNPDCTVDMTNDDLECFIPTICIFKACFDGNDFVFCIDTRDGCDTGTENGNGYCLHLLRKVRFYFKVNYNARSIADNPELSRYSEKIIPTNPFFPVKPNQLLSFLPRLLPSMPTNRLAWNILKRLRDLARLVDLDKLRRLRHTSKEIDIFFVTQFYHYDIHEAENQFRLSIMNEILKYPQINAVIGFTSRSKLAGEYADYWIKPYPPFEYFQCISRAKVALYFRGVHDCLSFKFGQLLAMGMPITGQSISNNREYLYGKQYFIEQFSCDSPQEIVSSAVALIEDPSRLALLAQSNAAVFDSDFTPAAVATRILYCLTV